MADKRICCRGWIGKPGEAGSIYELTYIGECAKHPIAQQSKPEAAAQAEAEKAAAAAKAEAEKANERSAS
jgi:hypothetical protein